MDKFIKNMLIIRYFGWIFVVLAIPCIFLGLAVWSGQLKREGESQLDEYHMYASDYMEYSRGKVNELYDSANLIYYEGRYDDSGYAGNRILLTFVFKDNNLTNEEYKTIIKENTEKIYDALKDRYIVRKGIADSGSDIRIYFDYCVPNKFYAQKKTKANLDYICGFVLNYTPSIDGDEWPAIDSSNYTLNTEK